MDNIFDDYMGCQYREGYEACATGIPHQENPYDLESQMGEAWLSGWRERHKARFSARQGGAAAHCPKEK